MSDEERSNEESCAWRNETASHACERVALLARIAAQKAARIKERRELAAALARIAAVEATCSQVEADDEEHLNRFGQHLPGSVVRVAEMVRAVLAASPTPTGPEPATQPCRDCGCPLREHHKLRCESVSCPGGCNGWTCPEHGLVLCGCTYLGGPATPEPTEETP